MTRPRRRAAVGVLLALVAAGALWALRAASRDEMPEASPAATSDEPSTRPAREPALAAAPAASADDGENGGATGKAAASRASTRVEGTVRTAAGKPVGAVTVRLLPRPEDLWSEERTTVARKDGSFRFDDPPLGVARVFVRGGGWVSVGLQDAAAVSPDPLAVVVERDHVASVALTVVPTVRAVGTVVDPDGKPLRGAKVYLFARPASEDGRTSFLTSYEDPVARPVALTETDLEGHFAVDGLAAGAAYDGVAEHPRFLPARDGPHVASPSEPCGFAFALRAGRFIDVTVVSEDGKPVPQAQVWPNPSEADAKDRAELASRLSRFHPWSPSTTDAEGRVRIGPVEPAPIELTTKVEGFLDDWKSDTDWFGATGKPLEERAATKPTPFVAPVGTDSVTLRLRRGLSITGRVVDEAGKPLAGVSVQAQKRYTSESGSGIRGFDDVATDAEGRFRLDGMPAGTITLAAKTWKPLRSTTKDVEAGAANVTIVLGAASAAGVEVMVVDAEGRAVPRATLHTSAWQGRAFEAVDGRGQIDIDLSFGFRDAASVDVTDPRDAKGKALDLAGARVVFRRGGPRVATVRLEPAATIEGRVLAPEGTGVGGVDVMAVVSDDEVSERMPDFLRPAREGPVTPARARTDASGSFRIGGLPARPFRLHFEVVKPYMAPSPIEARAGGPPAEIRLRRGVIETITVLDPRGEPLAGAFVASLLLRDGSADPLESIAAKAAGITLSGTTAADGTIRLGPLDPDRPRRLAVRPPDGPVELRSTALEPWTPRNETVRLERGSFVRGVVQDKKGVPVAHAKVSATVSGSPAVDTYADATGAFEHRELPPGDVRLVAFLPVREVYGESEPAGPELVVATGRDDVVLVVDHGAELAVRVENLPASAEALEAMLIPDGEAASKRYHPSRLEGGRLRFSGLRGDTRYSLFIGPCPEAPDNSLWLTAVRGDAGEMTVRLVPGRTVRGRLVAPPGSDWLGVEVAMGPAALRGFEHEVGDGGRFEIRGVPVGPARIQGFAQDAEGRPLSGEATTSGDEVEVTLTPTKSHTMLR